MKRSTALVLVVAVSLGSLVLGGPTCTSSVPIVGQISSVIHEPSVTLEDAVEDGDECVYPDSAPDDDASSGSSDSIPKSSRYEPGAAGDWSWSFSLRTRYSEVESDLAVRTLGREGRIRSWTTDLGACLVGDRWTVGIRVPAHPVVHALVEQLGRPIISTSAITSSRGAPRRCSNSRRPARAGRSGGRSPWRAASFGRSWTG